MTKACKTMLAAKRPLILLIGLACAMIPGTTAADPRKAVSDRGPAPAWLARGSHFSGPVVYVGDGDSLCIRVNPGAAGWVEVRLADFYAPEIGAVGGPHAKAELMRRAGVVEGGRGH